MKSGLNLRITHKIAAIGLVGIAGLLLVGGIYEAGSRSQEASRLIASDARTMSDLGKRLKVEMLEARRDEKNFLMRRKEEYANRHAELAAAVSKDFDKLKSMLEAAGLADLASSAADARQGFISYVESFVAAVGAQRQLGLDEKTGLNGALRKAAHEIESTLKPLDKPALMAQLLMMRRHEKDFMLRRDPKYLTELKAQFLPFLTSLTELDIEPEATSKLTDQLDRYFRDFNNWAKVEQERTAIEATMAKTFGSFEPPFVKLIKQIEEIGQRAEAAEAATRDAVRMRMLLAILVTVTGMAVLSFLIGRAISRPLSGMTGAMTSLAAGQLETALPGLGRKDEIGEMAGAAEIFKSNMIEANRLRADQIQQEQAQSRQRREDRNRMASGFQETVGSIIDKVSSEAGGLEAAAATLTTTAQTTLGLAETVSMASGQAASNIQSVATAADEMTASVEEIARQVRESSDIAKLAVEEAGRADTRIATLSRAAAQIGDVVKLISGIAEQTNLLALNATIEAARAGEAGRGFAIVAQEVKALAAQTGKATEEISEQISQMLGATEGTVSAIKQIGTVIARMSETSAVIASAVEEQGAATREIARNVQMAANGSNQVVAAIEDVNTGATATGSASGQVLASAQSLSSEANQLKLEVERFLNSLRAA
ncbi:MAG: chemotaxis protein [Proteobacteria bacterium SG_bin9]|nr:MAG: chemotaxis protein [Proteobacteria bacterium SG_bin9]